jgi:bacteriocin biosynthesis cyclodehydratase domain-containing protein
VRLLRRRDGRRPAAEGDPRAGAAGGRRVSRRQQDGERPLARPQLLRHYRVRFEPSTNGAEDTLVFRSENRRVAIRGRRLEAFLDEVVPLLDGRHELDDIVRRSSRTFEPEDVEQTIALLVEQRVAVDAGDVALADAEAARAAPQWSYLHEVSSDPAVVRERLAHARVTVVGLGPVGALAASSLAASNVGRICCVDASPVSAADPHLAQLFALTDVGSPRADVVRDRIRAVNPDVSVDLRADGDLARAVEGSDFVLGCLDSGLGAITDALNTACLQQRIPWSHATATAFEGIVGPTVVPYETPCYRCYQSRLIACEDDPAAALRELEADYDNPRDLSATRENTAFAVGIVAHLLALQAFQYLVGLWPKSVGRVLVVDFLASSVKEHLVLRKPWCTACFSTRGQA